MIIYLEHNRFNRGKVMDPIIGREEELATFEEAYDSDSPELIAIFGRRRVGKTFLVWSYFISGRRE